MKSAKEHVKTAIYGDTLHGTEVYEAIIRKLNFKAEV